MSDEQSYQLSHLLRVMQRLRDPLHGCPWDLAQDFSTIVPSTLEECYELTAAIEQQDFPHVREELGDLLFQVVFYAQLGAERGLFDFSSVVQVLVEKLLRRHPHVFADGEIEGVVSERVAVEQVKTSWEEIKQQERHDRQQSGVLADVPTALPALSRAQKIQKRASQVGFDWDSTAGVLLKVEEELAEFKEAQVQDISRQEEELGDLLFSCVNLSRHAGLDAEAALRRATRKFEARFQLVEAGLQEAGEDFEQVSVERLDQLWEQAKKS